MRSSMFLFLFCLGLLGFGAAASADSDACDARADAVVADLGAKADQPLSERELELARAAALAGCSDDAGSDPAPEPSSEPPKPAATRAQKPQQSASERFWAGLFSFENKDVASRGGNRKYKYVEDRK